jgi:hypothetical protein
VRLTLSEGGAEVLDTILSPEAARELMTPGLAAGAYSWRTVPVAQADSLTEGIAEGILEVESRSTEVLRARWTPSAAPAAPEDPELDESSGSELRTHLLPYLLLLGLLFAEWVLRRRRGLR